MIVQCPPKFAPFSVKAKTCLLASLTCLSDTSIYRDTGDAIKEIGSVVLVTLSRAVATLLFPISAAILVAGLYWLDHQERKWERQAAKQ